MMAGDLPLLLRLVSLPLLIAAVDPQIRVHQGHIHIGDGLMSYPQAITSYVVGEKYTFEIYLDDTMRQDYMIDECDMDGKEFIAAYGCVQCSQCVLQSIETESYNKPGAVKRTLVWFIAQSPLIQFSCKVTKIDCAGCAERSCQRQNFLAIGSYLHRQTVLSYPPYPIAGGPFPVGGGSRGTAWPWWLWLLLLLLLLLLLCCLLALCLAAWLRRRKRTTTTTTTVAAAKDKESQGVGTDKVVVHCVSTATEDLHKIQPAVAVEGATGAAAGAAGTHTAAAAVANGDGTERTTQYTRSKSRQEIRDYDNRRYDEDRMAGGSYSVREGRVHEGYSRTIPREVYYASNDRNDFDRRQYRDDKGFWSDRSSYRNFAYERDMGRVEPLDGYDEVETREKTYCLSDDEDVIEKDIKRTHTTRFVQETREVESSASDEERFREEEHQHAAYTHSLPV